MLEDLRIGVPVNDKVGQHLGTLQRIVIERQERRVTHLVVDPGLLESGNLLAPGGWEKPRTRLIPVEAIVTANKEQVTLSIDEKDFDQQPLFEQSYSTEADVQTGETEPVGEKPRFHLGDLIHYIATSAGLGAAPYEPTTEIVFQEGQNSAEITEGTPVWRKAPHEELGTIERVLVEAETQRISAVVLRRKGFGGKLVQLPATAIADVEDGVLHVTLSDAELAKLPPYQQKSVP